MFHPSERLKETIIVPEFMQVNKAWNEVEESLSFLQADSLHQ